MRRELKIPFMFLFYVNYSEIPNNIILKYQEKTNVTVISLYTVNVY